MAASGERILVVEGDPDISGLIARQALKPLGYNVIVVGDAVSAIKQAVQTPPDLIAANPNLPDDWKKKLNQPLGDGIGLLLVVRKADREIDRSVQSLLEAVADFASISLVNSRLFRTVEQTAEAARLNEKTRDAMLETLRESIREEMQVSMYPLDALVSGAPGPLSGPQEQALKTIQNSLQRLSRAAEKTIPPDVGKVR